MNQEQTEDKPAVKKTTKGFRPSRWLWILIAVAAVAIIASGVIWFMGSKDSTVNGGIIKTKPDTAEEVKTKQYLSSLRGDIVRYFEEKKTYEGWTPNQATLDQVKKSGSELKTQAMTKDTYVIFAKMPSSKLTFCMDNKGFTGEIKNLMPWATSCQ